MVVSTPTHAYMHIYIHNGIIVLSNIRISILTMRLWIDGYTLCMMYCTGSDEIKFCIILYPKVCGQHNNKIDSTGYDRQAYVE